LSTLQKLRRLLGSRNYKLVIGFAIFAIIKPKTDLTNSWKKVVNVILKEQASNALKSI